MLHVLLYCLLCLVPALILLPLRFLDREPRNETAQEQDGARDSATPDSVCLMRHRAPSLRHAGAR